MSLRERQLQKQKNNQQQKDDDESSSVFYSDRQLQIDQTPFNYIGQRTGKIFDPNKMRIAEDGFYQVQCPSDSSYQSSQDNIAKARRKYTFLKDEKSAKKSNQKKPKQIPKKIHIPSVRIQDSNQKFRQKNRRQTINFSQLTFDISNISSIQSNQKNPQIEKKSRDKSKGKRMSTSPLLQNKKQKLKQKSGRRQSSNINNNRNDQKKQYLQKPKQIQYLQPQYQQKQSHKQKSKSRQKQRKKSSKKKIQQLQQYQKYKQQQRQRYRQQLEKKQKKLQRQKSQKRKKQQQERQQRKQYENKKQIQRKQRQIQQRHQRQQKKYNDNKQKQRQYLQKQRQNQKQNQKQNAKKQHEEKQRKEQLLKKNREQQKQKQQSYENQKMEIDQEYGDVKDDHQYKGYNHNHKQNKNNRNDNNQRKKKQKSKNNQNKQSGNESSSQSSDKEQQFHVIKSKTQNLQNNKPNPNNYQNKRIRNHKTYVNNEISQSCSQQKWTPNQQLPSMPSYFGQEVQFKDYDEEIKKKFNKVTNIKKINSKKQHLSNSDKHLINQFVDQLQGFSEEEQLNLARLNTQSEHQTGDDGKNDKKNKNVFLKKKSLQKEQKKQKLEKQQNQKLQIQDQPKPPKTRSSALKHELSQPFLSDSLRKLGQTYHTNQNASQDLNKQIQKQKGKRSMGKKRLRQFQGIDTNDILDHQKIQKLAKKGPKQRKKVHISKDNEQDIHNNNKVINDKQLDKRKNEINHKANSKTRENKMKTQEETEIQDDISDRDSFYKKRYQKNQSNTQIQIDAKDHERNRIRQNNRIVNQIDRKLKRKQRPLRVKPFEIQRQKIKKQKKKQQKQRQRIQKQKQQHYEKYSSRHKSNQKLQLQNQNHKSSSKNKHRSQTQKRGMKIKIKGPKTSARQVRFRDQPQQLQTQNQNYQNQRNSDKSQHQQNQQETSNPNNRYPRRNRTQTLKYWLAQKPIYNGKRQRQNIITREVYKLCGFMVETYNGQQLKIQDTIQRKQSLIQRLRLDSRKTIDFDGFDYAYDKLEIQFINEKGRQDEIKPKEVEIFHDNTIERLKRPVTILPNTQFTIQNTGLTSAYIKLTLFYAAEEYIPQGKQYEI